MIACAALAHAGERIRAYDVDIVAAEDGSLTITETIRYDFGDARRHGIYRDVPLLVRDPQTGWTRPVGIRLIAIQRDGQPEPYKATDGWFTGAYSLRWRIGRRYLTLSGAHDYTIRYRALAALVALDEAHDGWLWRAIGAGWDVPMDRVRVRFTPLARLGARGVQVRAWLFTRAGRRALPIKAKDGAFTLAAGSLAPHQGVLIEAAFPRGALPATPPRRITELTRAILWPQLGYAIAALALALSFFAAWLLRGRDGRIRPRPQPEPPAGLEAAEVGLLCDERAKSVHLAGALLELAQQGIVRIHAREKEGTLTYLRPPPTFSLYAD
ncbi:MAG: DUF2207 domain-containing protein, partial [Zetaproteobacteria bacterium]